MNAAVRDCLALGYEPLIEVLDLPDPDDRHVLAAAIKVNAQLVVTWNQRHFPQDKLARGAYGQNPLTTSFATRWALIRRPYGRASSKLWIRVPDGP